MGISEESLQNELQHAIKLHNKPRGEIAELAFMRKAATLGFAVAKPWGDSDRYDVILRAGKSFWRVQVKSVIGSGCARPHYRVRTSDRLSISYTAEEIDFLVAYIFPLDTWYSFPVAIVQKLRFVELTPGSSRSRYEQYREAWDLMRPSSLAESTSIEPVPEGPASASAIAGG